jgi:SagB-type dehydrogenase family enzyme
MVRHFGANLGFALQQRPEATMHKDWRRICNEFMQATSYTPEGWDEWWADRDYSNTERPETYLTYPNAACHVPLGEPERPSGVDLWQVFEQRRSKRNFLPQAMSLNELNLLLWSSQGITADMGQYQLRTAPSSGALFPIETYLVVNAVDGLEPGIYHLDVKNWQLEGIRMGDFRARGHAALRGQAMTEHAAVNVVWTAVMERCRAKYFERAYRYVWWDSAAVMENFLLAATGLGLGACAMGSWYDDLVHDLLEIDGKQHFSALTASVGRIAGEDWLHDRRPPSPSDFLKKT